MKILVFDTETSGLNPGWNVILQLSYQIVDSDSWASIKTVNHYFPWPEDKSRVSPDAICVNGLTEELLSEKQLSERKVALEEFVSDKDSCDLLVAHNLEFDKKFIIASCQEEGVKYASSGWLRTYDTMKRTTRLCQIPKEWGTGYKWPKLTELADFLCIGYSNIPLHDSSGDVELTKLCFKQLVYRGECYLPRDTRFTVSLKVNAPDDLSFVIRDEKGEAFSPLLMDRLRDNEITDKDIKAAQQEAIKIWSDEQEEKRNELVQIYRKSPRIKTEEEFWTDVKAIRPNHYIRKVFEEQEPSKTEIQEQLEKEAEREVSSWMFWTLKKKRQEYVESRIDSFYQKQVDDYNQKYAQYEESESKMEAEFNNKSLKQCEEYKRHVTALIAGDSIELLDKEVQKKHDLDISLPYSIEAHTEDGVTITIIISLPQPEDMPQLEGVRMSSGNYKIKNISDRDKKCDYSNFVLSLAFYVASYYFNISPKFKTIITEGRVSVDNEELNLYGISFDRTTLSSLDLENTDIESALSKFQVTNNITKGTLSKLFVAKEQKNQLKINGISVDMHDPFFYDVARMVIQEQNVSIAMIQRMFKIGYKRAETIMEQLEKTGIVGIAQGGNPREVLVSNEEDLEIILSGM